MRFIEENGVSFPTWGKENEDFIREVEGLIGAEGMALIEGAEKEGVTITFCKTPVDFHMAQTEDIFGKPVLKINGHMYVTSVAKSLSADPTIRRRVDFFAIETIAHELCHVEQSRAGRLTYSASQTVWEGEVWDKARMEEVGYHNLPWEIEAHEAGVAYMRRYGFMVWITSKLKLFNKRSKAKKARK